MIPKHAYCIIAHEDKYILQTLISCIDDQRNDIFLLVDSKSPYELTQNLTCNNKLIIIPPNKRININWGGGSQIKAEILLFKEVINTGENYSFIHLISGSDLPIKNQDVIHKIFADVPIGTNFISFSSGINNINDLKFKTNYYHFFIEKYKCKNSIVRNVCKLFRSTAILFQKTIKFKRKNPPLHKGTNWVSISLNFCKYIVSRESEILKKYRYTPCADEIYKQTLIMQSEFKNTIVNDSLRLIDWTRGNPYIWRMSDFDTLNNSTKLFARKFSSRIDQDIINAIRIQIK